MIRFIHASLAFFIVTGGLAYAQSYDQAPIGAFDQLLSNNSAAGWACFPGDPNTKVVVQLGVHSNYGSPITWVTSAVADKQRNDIGRSGQCGPPTGNEESYYHGFEWPVILSEYLEKNKTHGLYAWV